MDILWAAKNVSKQIQGNVVLEDINLTIYQGEMVAITGHNGSGKSSLLKLMAGFYKETKGNVKSYAEKVAYVPEHFPEDLRFTVYDYLMLVGQMSGRMRSELQSDICKYSKDFMIESYLQLPLRKCSKGTRQKVGIIQALLSKPDLLLLDEPLIGLDQDSIHYLIHLLINVKRTCTLVFVVHDHILIDQLAERVIQLDKGMIRLDEKAVRKRERSIKAYIRDETCINRIQTKFPTQLDEENMVTIFVPIDESDQIIVKLIESGCSIVEVKER